VAEKGCCGPGKFMTLACDSLPPPPPMSPRYYLIALEILLLFEDD